MEVSAACKVARVASLILSLTGTVGPWGSNQRTMGDAPCSLSQASTRARA